MTVIKILYVLKFKGETLDSALRKCGGFKGCFSDPKEAISSAKAAGFDLKDIRLVKVSYETLKQLDHLMKKGD